MRVARTIGRGVIAVALVAGGTTGCATRTGTPPTVAPASAREPLPCDGPADLIAWQRAGRSRQAALDAWCASVGPPVVVAGNTPAAPVGRLVVVSWNVGVGAGRLAAFVDQIRRRAVTPSGGDVGVVVLVQEAFRGGPDVAGEVPAGIDVPSGIRPARPVADIVDVARSLGLSLAYVPSMRNGAQTSRYEREDRGNAILSTEPLADVTALELPLAKQRRVAVAATVTARGTGRQVRVVAAHLDTPGRGRVAQAEALAAFLGDGAGLPVVLGIDANAVFGRRDAAVRRLEAILTLPASCTRGRTGPWPFGRLDFVFTNLPDAATTCETLTDRYGSDHVPVLLTVDGSW